NQQHEHENHEAREPRNGSAATAGTCPEPGTEPGPQPGLVHGPVRGPVVDHPVIVGGTSPVTRRSGGTRPESASTSMATRSSSSSCTPLGGRESSTVTT